jgi:hypothetical protein
MESNEENKLTGLINQSNDSTVKHSYYVLSVTASCIAFSLYQTRNDVISIHHIPLGLAIISWGLSFYFGCKYIQGTAELMRQNYFLLTKSRTMSINIEQMLQPYIKRVSKSNNLQFRLLLFGAVLFITWHILMMSTRTFVPAVQSFI